jgi:non-ribosomal peptide synthase protein (TIGR01720 family)
VGSGATQGEEEGREYLIEVSGSVREGILELVWSYSERVHRRESIEEWARGYVRALRSIIEHCRSEDAGGYTPSDFPEAALSQRELDELMEELSDYAE